MVLKVGIYSNPVDQNNQKKLEKKSKSLEEMLLTLQFEGNQRKQQMKQLDLISKSYTNVKQK